MTWFVLFLTFEGKLAAEVKIDQWSCMAPIEMKKVGTGRALEFALAPQVMDASNTDLSDLRIVTGSGDEVGYVIETDHGSDSKAPLTVKLYNRSHVPQKESSVTVDFDSKTLKNNISIATPGTNFRRRVSIEGSDDGESWKIIRGDAFLFRVQDKGEKAPAFDKSEIQIPDNDLRKLRITVFNGPDDPDGLEIQDVKAWQRSRTTPKTINVPVVAVKVEEKKGASELLLDLGFRNLPLRALKLDFSDSNFFRSVRVYGRNSESRVVRTRTEDSPAGEKTVPMPWTSIAEGTLYRFSGQSGTEESLSLKLTGAGFRYLRVEIRNGDAPPLRFTWARADRLVPKIVTAPVTTGKLALYVGNPEAKKPLYDVVHYVDRLRKDGITEASLGSRVPNPAYNSAKKLPPWSERHKAIIWLALLAMAAVLGYLVYRMASSGKKAAG